MDALNVAALFKKTGALLDGHFLYASGRHGRQFLQAARVLQYPEYTEQLCKAMAERFANDRIDLVCGPATGGIVLAYETARHLRCRAVFTEKDADGGMSLKRGFHLPPATRTLVVEDVITTGGSVKKTIAHLRERKAEIAGTAVLMDRSGGTAEFNCRYEPLEHIAMESWAPEDCPLCKRGEPLVDPDDIVVA